jgi:hypothetical protein
LGIIETDETFVVEVGAKVYLETVELVETEHILVSALVALLPKDIHELSVSDDLEMLRGKLLMDIQFVT